MSTSDQDSSGSDEPADVVYIPKISWQRVRFEENGIQVVIDDLETARSLLEHEIGEVERKKEELETAINLRKDNRGRVLNKGDKVKILGDDSRGENEFVNYMATVQKFENGLVEATIYYGSEFKTVFLESSSVVLITKRFK